MRNAQRHITPLVTRVAFSDDKHPRLTCKELANLVRAQIPHFRDFPNSIVPFDVYRGLDL